MKTNFLITVLLFILISLVGCSKEDSINPTPEQILNGGQSVKAYKNETGDENIELQPNAIMISNDINSVLVDVGATTLKFTNTSALDLIKTGDVIYSLPTSKFPEGYAYKILSKENIGEQIVCNYESATMDEVFVKFSDKIDVKPNLSKEGLRVYDIMPRNTNRIKNTNGSIYNVIGFDSEKFTGVNFTLNTAELTYIIYDYDNNYKDTKYDQIKAKLKLTTDYSSVDAVFDEGIFAVWGYPTIGISCELESGGIEADADLAKQLSDKLKNELVGKKITLMSFDITQFSVSSLAIKPTVDIYMILELNAEGKIKAKFSYSDTRIYFKAQNYKSSLNDNKLICEVQKWGTPDFSIEAKMEASTSLGIGVGIKFNFPAFEYKKGEKSYFGIFSDVSYEGQIIAKGGWGLNGSLQCKEYGYSLKPYWKTYGEARLGIFKNKLLSIDIQPDINAKELSILPLIEKSYNFCENQPEIPTNGLVAYYPFNGNANDESGNNNNGTVNGATLTTDRHGIANKAYSFDGVDDYLEVLHSSTLDISSNISISTWINVSQNNISQRIVDKTTVNGNDSYMLDIRPDNTLRFLVAAPPNVTSTASSNSIIFNTNKWYHVVSTYDGNVVKFFVNGVFVNDFSISGSNIRNDLNLSIGANSLLNGDWFNGKIDDIRIYNTALPSQQITEIFNTEKSK